MKALVTLGTFDGVHKGHQDLVRQLLARARSWRLRPTAVVFDSPPRFFFHPAQAAPLLTSAEERRELLLGLGVGEVRVLPFNRHLAHVPHARFFEEYILRRCRAGGLLVGQDFAFGRGRKGDIAWLTHVCDLLGMRLEVVRLARARGKKIGSTHIRELLLEGEVREAARLLGRPHFVAGVVVRGDGMGRKLGAPTANLEVPPERLVPPGVFQVRVRSDDAGAPVDGLGACNVGVRPSVEGSHERHVEVHVLGWSGSLYGRRLRLDFLRRIREERRFPSLAALKAQIAQDLLAAERKP